jgi:L-lactate utilization protein LutC
MELPDLTPNMEFAAPASRAQMERALAALAQHQIEAEIVTDREAARDRVLELVPENAEVHVALSETMRELGVTEVIDQSGKFDAIRPKLMKLDRNTQRREMTKLATAPEYVLGSVHAVTEDGHLVVGSGTGSQLAAYVSGAAHVILVAGAQKVVPNVEVGLRRLREYSYPMEDARMKAAGRGGTILAKTLIISWDSPGRTHLILVEETIGF